MLLSEFASGLIQSQTRRTLYESYARALCHECYDHLRTAFPAVHAHLIPQSERIFFATELLAAVMVVTGRDLVQLSTGQLTSEACLRLEDILVRVAETIDSGVGPRISESELKSALDTAIVSRTALTESLFWLISSNRSATLIALA